ncbi:stonustoxin subunit beta-like [Centropristis striata]|uniref:stonustoxin subunit beta-like n=1 Tax=Centropristis striata TaxID=184440 RepID=UPI0027E175FB|nr:stonustoxin subunit beta-like [Centropristis striata]
MALDTMVTAALGRPFTLGMLYDARKDQLVPGFTLWNEKTVEENTVESSQHSSVFEISASDNTDSKSTLLDVDASLKASFLSGLIEVGGSAKYLNDQKKSHNQSRVTCQYKATTNFKQLSMIGLDTAQPQQSDMIHKGFATHVVTGILYGANAFFVFDSQKLDTSSVQDIQGSMEAVIKKIPSFSIEGKVDIKLTDEEKALTQKFSCKFHGDFLLESNPASFEDAVKTYAQLPQLIGKNGENGVPLKVWLMPLTYLYSEAAELKREISIELVSMVHDTLEDIRRLEIRCSDSLDEVKNFPPIQEQLSTFQKLCAYYAITLKQALAKNLPSIREGKEEEISSTGDLFIARDKSPFSHEKLSRWLDHKEREINVIRSCVDILEGAKIVLSQSELDREALDPGKHDVLCFVFTSLKNTDPFLDQMAHYLDPSKNAGTTTEDQWYYSTEVVKKMRKKARYFQEFIKTQHQYHCFIAAIANEAYTGASAYYYIDGELVNQNDPLCHDPLLKAPQTEEISCTVRHLIK